MVLIIISLITGYVGIMFGSMFGDWFMGVFGIVGFLSPGLYVLEKIYREVKKSKLEG